ncbi:HK97 family phage prohead protease [Labrenzia sp. MBR-25]
MTREQRALVAEIRAKGRRLEGYAATFGTETRISDFIEVIAPGAFRASLDQSKDILALVDHDAKRVLARTRSGSLRLSEDSRGLAFDLDLPETSYGRDVLALAERGDIGGMSFAFSVDKDGDQWRGDRRELRSVVLHEISVVTSFPAYDGTTVHARKRGLELPPKLAAARKWMESI